jgi:PKD repeat protein
MAMFVALPTVFASSSQVSVGMSSNFYFCMQAARLYANLTSNGAPVLNSVLAAEVDSSNSTTWHPILLRSLKSSQSPDPLFFDNNLKIVGVTPIDANWIPRTSFKRGSLSWAYFNITIRNSGDAVTGLIAWSVIDVALVPLGANAYGSNPGYPITINPGLTTVLGSSSIPSWAALGTATVYVNIFTDAPKYAGYPLTNETSNTFQIQSSFGPSRTYGSFNQSLYSAPALTQTYGFYNFSWRAPPYPTFGTYDAYASYFGATPAVDSTSFQIMQASTPPQASFSWSPSAPYVNGTVYFDASSSFSYNGTITNYKWNWGDGSPQQSTSSKTITHVFKAKGTYTVTLNVTDTQGLWSVSQQPVPVSGPIPPVANFIFTPSPTWVNASTKFDASSSVPGWNGTGNSPIVTCTWNFGDGTPVVTTNNTVTYHQFRSVGNFVTTLTVKDKRGWNGTTAQVVQVQTKGTPPQASFSWSPSTPYINAQVLFDASSSFSYYGTITNYKWNWGDGSPQQSTTSSQISHAFNSNGTFLVTLNVTDSVNLWSITKKPVRVFPPTPPFAFFVITPSPTWINATTTFDASLSLPGWNGTGNPPIVSYTWRFGDGTPVVTTNNTVTYHQFRNLGTFNITLTVTDTRGWNGTITQTVQVTTVVQRVDVAVTRVDFTPPPSGLYQIAPKYYQPYKGWAGYILVTVLNNGTTAASFDVTVNYSNGTSYSLGTRHLTNLASLNSTVLTYSWDTSSMKPTMNYTITASATVLPSETNTQNNQYSIIVRVKGPGDVNGDGLVNLKDLGYITGNWLAKVPPANLLGDINGDGVVNLKDLGYITSNWQRTYA